MGKGNTSEMACDHDQPCGPFVSKRPDVFLRGKDADRRSAEKRRYVSVDHA